MGAGATAGGGGAGGATTGAAATAGAATADGAGETQVPASHTRSPLQSVSFSHCACDSDANNKQDIPPRTATNTFDDIAVTLAVRRNGHKYWRSH